MHEVIVGNVTVTDVNDILDVFQDEGIVWASFGGITSALRR